MGTYAMTGGATGIGAAIQQQLVDEGHRVIVVDIKDADVVADLSTRQGREYAVEELRSRAADGLDGYIPCAGLGPSVTPASLITQVNYFAAVETIEGVKDLLIKKGGSVVVISSNSAPMGADPDSVEACLQHDEVKACAIVDQLGEPQNAYGGSKLALTRWMRRNSTAYAASGVRLNAVAPGIVRTPLTDKVMADKALGQVMKDFADTVPVGSLGEPEQIADAVMFMLSDKASFMCGSVIFVDGGHDAMLRPDDF
ncbi:NAD(P)-dependent dehydrogenase (short-subunit alcohol dehydrogenase family) [Sinobacterium caligoides]|uniref:NAD(P)-dependent dehydrogenase (Short-subunit alcohol dehydrogenase family) n=1 Tax=Sinobacterium caligoides TaxID=933926 RepID=A0A3N2DYC9_9GAMM|nr:SDR family oxidoreductase [Sinobacterium caligoides]ROS04777.1 NAD(P)-dependent dehydrogenase (short-subunit alcohol dehydrogenase family) [Sinobacterium caligoides]